MISLLEAKLSEYYPNFPCAVAGSSISLSSFFIFLLAAGGGCEQARVCACVLELRDLKEAETEEGDALLLRVIPEHKCEEVLPANTAA